MVRIEMTFEEVCAAAASVQLAIEELAKDGGPVPGEEPSLRPAMRSVYLKLMEGVAACPAE